MINLMFYHIIHLTLLAAPLLALKFYITVFSICIISLRFNFLLFVSIYCCSFFRNILRLYMLEEDARAEERNHRFTFFARFIRFIHLFSEESLFPLHSDARRCVLWLRITFWTELERPAMLTQHSTTQVGTTTHSFNFSMALL